MSSGPSDGQRLAESYSATLSTSTAYFRALLASANSKAWKVLPLPPPPTSPKGKESTTASPSIVVHRRNATAGEVFRGTVEMPLAEGVTVEGFRSLLGTPECRVLWDSMVESASTVEQVDEETRIVRTSYRLGWPSSPRDTVTISKTFNDADTIINISTSLPRSPDEPAYLRPAPPYVRAHVSLLAYCIQLPPSAGPVVAGPLPPSPMSPSGPSTRFASSPLPNRVRLTCFWQWDPKGSWAVGSSIGQHLPALLTGLADHAKDHGERIPLLTAFGKGVIISGTSFDTSRDTLNLDYSIVEEDTEEQPDSTAAAPVDPTDLNSVINREKEDRRRKVAAGSRLARTLDFAIPASHGWRIQVTVKSIVAAPEDDSASPPPWQAQIGRVKGQSASRGSSSSSPDRLLLRISQPRLPTSTSLLRIHVAIARDSSSRSVRINGVPQALIDFEPSGTAAAGAVRGLSARFGDVDSASMSGISLRTVDSVSSGVEGWNTGGGSVSNGGAAIFKPKGDRSDKAERAVLSLVRRNYIYFTSLLQEPEAKWRPVLEASKGVSVHQLDSIDRTLVVYRAEAVFVGVGIWDLLAVINSPGARASWDKTYEDAVLLEDVNELSEVMWWKSKAAWPVAARDSVLLKTTYKSPTSVHVFAFSTDDHALFPSIPPVDSSIIRTQVDLQGWSIEALSPNTTQVTLLEQSDPKGWSNKSSIPQIMAMSLAGIGEFAIRSGGPPLLTRLAHAKVVSSRYDLEKGAFRLEYQPAEWRRAALAAAPFPPFTPNASTATTMGVAPVSVDEPFLPAKDRTTHTDDGPIPNVECELRCDTDTWATSLDIVIDPPPQTVSCLRRHRLSAGGGGAWITIEHDSVLLGEDAVLVVVRKGTQTSAKDKNVVIVNGSKIKVDVQELPEAEVKNLSKQKRTKPSRIPLDQPPVLGAIRRRHPPADDETTPSTPTTDTSSVSLMADPLRNFYDVTSRFTSPLSRLWATVPDSSSSAIASPPEPQLVEPPVAPTLRPMQLALNALDSVRLLHSQAPDPGAWTLVVDKEGLLIEKRTVPTISTAYPVHRASRVIQGSSAEDVIGVVATDGCRKLWDDKLNTNVTLEAYGNGCSLGYSTSKCTFPFRDRGFLTASLTARGLDSAPSTPTNATASIASSVFHVSTSCPREAAAAFDANKLNPYVLPLGHRVIEGWVMETLDPYGNEQYIIPSTRCTYYSAFDYSGSIPMVVNSSINATLPRVLLGVESYLKTQRTPPLLRLPSSGVAFSSHRDDLTGPSANAVDLKVWDLQGADSHRVLLSSTFDPSESGYRSAVYVHPQPWINDVDVTPSARNSSLPFSSSGTTTDSSSAQLPSTVTRDARRVASNASLRTSDPPPESHLSTSAPSGRGMRHSPSQSSAHSSLSRASSTTVLDYANEFRRAERGKDFVVAEIIVDTKSFPAGYNVTSNATLAHRPVAPRPTPVPADPTAPATASPPVPPCADKPPFSLQPPTSTARLNLPLKIVISPLPIPVSHSASLSTSPPRRKHLIRVTLPTAQFQAPMRDPLHDVLASTPSKPSWLEAIEAQGAIVNLAIDALAGEPYEDPEQLLVTVEGTMVEVGRRERTGSTASLLASRSDSLDLAGHAWPRLRRTLLPPGVPGISAPEPPISPLPACLSEPTAVATHLQPDTVLSESEAPAEALPPSEPSAAPTLELRGKAITQPLSAPVVQAPMPPRKFSNASVPILNFFHLTRMSSPLSSSQPVTPDGVLPSDVSSSLDPSVYASTTTATKLALTAPTFSLTTVILVAVLSFLIGSLIRSLLSPADFVVFVNRDGKGALVEEGWREIRRLVEWKAGWRGDDVLLAIVKRT